MKKSSEFEAAAHQLSVSLLRRVDLYYPNQRKRLCRQFGLRNGIFGRV